MQMNERTEQVSIIIIYCTSLFYKDVQERNNNKYRMEGVERSFHHSQFSPIHFPPQGERSILFERPGTFMELILGYPWYFMELILGYPCLQG